LPKAAKRPGLTQALGAAGDFMRVLPILFLASSSLLVTACVTASDDFLLKGKDRQEVPLNGAKEMLVRCYCPKTSIKTRAGPRTVLIEAAGNYGSAGYHGEQEKPKAMPSTLLAFTVRNDGALLTLESKEWTYMHHFNLLTAVTVTAPPDVIVRFESIPHNELYDRQVPPSEK
jgi:hypothetical protein